MAEELELLGVEGCCVLAFEAGEDDPRCSWDTKEPSCGAFKPRHPQDEPYAGNCQYWCVSTVWREKERR